MEKHSDAFEELLDSSWQSFRQNLVQAYVLSQKGARETASRKTAQSITVETSKYLEPEVPVAEDLPDPVLRPEFSDSSNESGASGADPQLHHGNSQTLLPSGLQGLTSEEASTVRNRLRLRLGVLPSTKLVSGKSLHEAVVSLGLTRYTEEDMNDLINHLADFIGLRFENEKEANGRATMIGMGNIFGTASQDMKKPVGSAIWEWPAADRDGGHSRPTFQSGRTTFKLVNQQATSTYNVVPPQALIEVFLARDGEIHKKIFGPRIVTQFKAMREILMASDTNRLVAELTFVRINDLAAPPEPTHPLMYIEPLVAILIVANGVMIGFQTDPAYEGWTGFFYIELVLFIFLLLEIALRMHLLRWGPYWCGQDRYWNYFDMFLAGTAMVDLSTQILSEDSFDMFGASLLRFFRLIRLVRIVKLFRVKFMKDLRLMVKGLVAGVKTLTLAFALLFAVLYVISGFATITVGNDPKTQAVALDGYFHNIPASMFTAFRCYTGECINEAGQPIPHILAEQFGLPFILAFVASYMLVTMGIFNVILAVYVDITMRAAKENDATTAEQYSRESVRIARTTRELLKKFAGAYHQFQNLNEPDIVNAMKSKTRINIDGSAGLFTDDEITENVSINKELFLLVIQDHHAQSLMDDLDLPHDRANLFEIIDADGSGTLGLPELVQGLLKIRGEINKSDTVAALLATKAVQNQVSELMEENSKRMQKLENELQLRFADLSFRLTHGNPSVTKRDEPLELLNTSVSRGTSPFDLDLSSKQLGANPQGFPTLSGLALPVRPGLQLEEEVPIDDAGSTAFEADVTEVASHVV